jgi:hypothetical protein
MQADRPRPPAKLPPRLDLQRKGTISFRADWAHSNTSRLRYDAAAHTWSLYCCDRNERWFPYSEVAASHDVAPLLDAVDTDPTGIFWG